MSCTPTLGPWHRRGGKRWEIIDMDGELITDIVKRPHGDKDEGDGNGDLIAAAPELLEALKRCRAAMRHMKDAIEPRILSLFPGLPGIEVFGAEAIAKAEGVEL